MRNSESARPETIEEVSEGVTLTVHHSWRTPLAPRAHSISEFLTLRYLTRCTATQTPSRRFGPIWHGEQCPTLSLNRTSSRNRWSRPP